VGAGDAPTSVDFAGAVVADERHPRRPDLEVDVVERRTEPNVL
jgi:hypothetical protein